MEIKNQKHRPWAEVDVWIEIEWNWEISLGKKKKGPVSTFHFPSISSTFMIFSWRLKWTEFNFWSPKILWQAIQQLVPRTIFHAHDLAPTGSDNRSDTAKVSRLHPKKSGRHRRCLPPSSSSGFFGKWFKSDSRFSKQMWKIKIWANMSYYFGGT